MKKLNVSECFYSIQGEGVTMGVPSVFLRLGGCNLMCKGSGWICDSIEVWSKSVATEFKDVIKQDWVDRLKLGAHLVITGGEPLLHQRKLIEYLDWFRIEYGFLPYVEVETNGTILPAAEFTVYVQQWNCSPKLSNSGETKERRYKHEVLELLSYLNTQFKFVVSSKEDIKEIRDNFSYFGCEKFVLMPAGDSFESLKFTRQLVAEECIQLGWRYCDRLHIVIWNKKTGV